MALPGSNMFSPDAVPLKRHRQRWEKSPEESDKNN